ncbi:hypothetical protein DFJ73DRAFT_857973 [Zopfochytrium polystomum]|nr:hypothetical protein DFJ73DRAFT_857973 [Zopfochytrium polystomum]
MGLAEQLATTEAAAVTAAVLAATNVDEEEEEAVVLEARASQAQAEADAAGRVQVFGGSASTLGSSESIGKAWEPKWSSGNSGDGAMMGVRVRRTVTAPPLTADNKHKIHSLLANVGRWDWDVFQFEELAPKPLYTLALFLFHKAGLMSRFNIPMDKLRHFLVRIEAGYRTDVPYHNSTHACDVLQAAHCFVTSDALIGRLSDLEVLGAYLATIIHDYDHPGYNNQHLIAIQSPQAVLYNDRSVLENYHVSAAWTHICKDENNLLANMSPDDVRAVREQCIDMVLATDLTSHFSTLSAFKNKVFAAGTFDLLNNHDDRILFWRVLIKCADVSNMGREWPLYWRWCDRIMTEFFRQGDEEKRLGLPVSPFMDRQTVLVHNVQLSFCDYICTPTFEAFNQVAGMPQILQNILKNRETLLMMKKKEGR